jgi:hypothetical protein
VGQGACHPSWSYDLENKTINSHDSSNKKGHKIAHIP